MEQDKGLSMYILLSITECVVVIPVSWGELFITLTKDPLIINQLPPETQSNTPVNVTNADLGQIELSYTNRDGSNQTEKYTPQKYDYYFDCGTESREVIEKVVSQFKKTYENNLDIQLANEDYPKTNPAIRQLQATFRAVRPLPLALKDSLFKSSSPGQFEEFYAPIGLRS